MDHPHLRFLLRCLRPWWFGFDGPANIVCSSKPARGLACETGTRSLVHPMGAEPQTESTHYPSGAVHHKEPDRTGRQCYGEGSFLVAIPVHASPRTKGGARPAERSPHDKRSGAQARFDPPSTQKPRPSGSHLWSGLHMGLAEPQNLCGQCDISRFGSAAAPERLQAPLIFLLGNSGFIPTSVREMGTRDCVCSPAGS
jgi:hypothetical protein